jgi:hypothetical protein
MRPADHNLYWILVLFENTGWAIVAESDDLKIAREKYSRETLEPGEQKALMRMIEFDSNPG